MNKNIYIIFFVSVSCLSWSATLTAAKTSEKSQPNILLISIDDLNDWVGVLKGHPQAKTPNIDALASQGVLFTNAHCQAPVCTSSRASLVTSKLPSSTGSYFLRPHLGRRAKGKTLAEDFKRRGYKTMNVGKVYGGGEKLYYDEYGGSFGHFGPTPRSTINGPGNHKLWDWGAYPDKDSKMPDIKIANWAIQKLKAKHDKPFFLSVGFLRPHVPMTVPAKWFDMFPLEEVQLPETIADDRNDLPEYAKNLTIGIPAPRHKWMVEKKQWKKAVQAYLACVAFVDHCVGLVTKALEESEHVNNTIVVLFSDHGFHLGEKGRWAKRSLWEESTRVPLIVKGFGFEPAVCHKPANLMDIYPTLLDMCGYPTNEELDGTSLKPLLHKPDMEWNQVAITSFGPKNHTVRTEHFRYIEYSDGSNELYDHRKDPNEWYNVVDKEEYKDIVSQLKDRLPKTNAPNLKGASNGLKAYHEAERIAGLVKATKK